MKIKWQREFMNCVICAIQRARTHKTCKDNTANKKSSSYQWTQRENALQRNEMFSSFFIFSFCAKVKLVFLRREVAIGQRVVCAIEYTALSTGAELKCSWFPLLFYVYSSRRRCCKQLTKWKVCFVATTAVKTEIDQALYHKLCGSNFFCSSFI